MDDVVQPVVERFLRVRRHTKDGIRKMHKPLLQLLALAQFAKNGRSQIYYDSAKPSFEKLLQEYGPPGKKYQLEYPFKFMANDGIWVATLTDGTLVKDTTTEGELKGSTGQFTAEIESALKSDSTLAYFVGRAVADYCLPTDLATDLLEALALLPSDGSLIQFEFSNQGRKRNSQWRGKVLSAWQSQCAFCGYDGMLNNSPVALDAAHIRWFNYDGPDDLNNGLALCVIDHRLFDRGVLGLTTQLRLEVSPQFHSSAEVTQRIHRLHGKQLNVLANECRPDNDHIEWHRREVFKAS